MSGIPIRLGMVATLFVASVVLAEEPDGQPGGSLDLPSVGHSSLADASATPDISEVAALRRMIQQQNRRIEELERSVPASRAGWVSSAQNRPDVAEAAQAFGRSRLAEDPNESVGPAETLGEFRYGGLASSPRPDEFVMHAQYSAPPVTGLAPTSPFPSYELGGQYRVMFNAANFDFHDATISGNQRSQSFFN